MAGISIPLTPEMIEGFENVAAGKGTLADVHRATGVASSTLSEKYRKWLRDQGSVAAVPSTKAKATGPEGFSLKGVRTASKKPQHSTRALLYTLEEGRGYAVEDLCREWNVQPDTLTKHAKSVGAFVYAEVSRENWIPAITYPKR